MMEFALNNIVAPTILSIAVIYIWGKLLNEKVDIKSIKFWGILAVMAASTILNYWITHILIRIVIIDIIQIGLCKILFNRRINDCIISILITRLIIVLSDCIYGAIITFGLQIQDDDIIKYCGTLFADITVAGVIFLISKIKLLYKWTTTIISWTENIKEIYAAIGVLFLLIVINFFVMNPHYDIALKYSLTFNTVIIFVYFFIYINSIKNQHKLIQVSDKYNTTLSSLKEYENMLNKYKVSNHENKNQFLTVRNMLDPKNEKEKEVMDYIDEFVENKIKDDEKIMEEACIIPEGGLRGLMYSKLVYMREKKINYELNIDKKVKTSDLIALNKEETLDVCKILGIFIDNAIEEVIDLDEKLISIDIYKEKKELCFSVTNNYHHTIDLEKIEEEGYTTKGNGHGFGLPLAKQLIEKHNNFKNLKQISENTFTQIIKIKIK